MTIQRLRSKCPKCRVGPPEFGFWLSIALYVDIANKIALLLYEKPIYGKVAFKMADESTIEESNEEDEQYRRRIDTILDGSYTEGLTTKPEEEVRELRDTAREVETEISFLRRLAQSRLDIFKAEIDRRAKGGSLADLIAALPGILASGETRSSAPNSRLSSVLAPSPAIDFKRGMETLVSDDSLVNIDSLTEEEIQTAMVDLEAFEEETSQTRKKLHGVIDQLENEIARRAIN